MKTPKRLGQAAVAVAALGLAGMAAAQGYPAKAIRFVVAYPMGGGAEYTARPRSCRSCRSAGDSPSSSRAVPAAAR